MTRSEARKFWLCVAALCFAGSVLMIALIRLAFDQVTS